MKEIEIKAYLCEKCGGIHTNKMLAELCCKEYYCEDCGEKTEKYWLVCPQCAEKRRYNKANKISYEEYCKKYPDHMLFYGGEYYPDLESLLEQFDKGKEPKYCYGTSKERVEIDLSCAITDAEEELPEDWEFENKDELYKFIKKWNEKNGQEVFYDNDKIIILISENDKNEYWRKYGE